jgi:membrane fusion protein (multidrug efflux system)
MTTVQQIDPIYVDLTQSSVQGLQLRNDAASGRLKLNGAGKAKVTLYLEDGRPYPNPGTLQFSDITVDPGTGAVTVRAVIPNPDSTLLPGMFVHARIDEGQADNVFVVPQAAVTHDQKGDATAMVVEPGNKVAARTLKVRGTQGTSWVVDSGLKDGDRVITAGVQRVRPGAVVEASEAPAAANVARNG